MAAHHVVQLSREGSFLTPQPIDIHVRVGEGPLLLTVEMPLDGFLAELAAAMPHPTTTWTRDGLAQAVRDAAVVVVQKMKDEHARSM